MMTGDSSFPNFVDIDDSEPPKFVVQVDGLDDSGALASKEGDEVTIKGKLIGKRLFICSLIFELCQE